MPYDVEMIKDFFEHLKWCLRVDHFECSSGPEAFDPELLGPLKRYARKWSTLRLLAEFALRQDDPALTETDMQEALRRFGAFLANRRAQQLQHLEALDELLKEALAHARGNRILAITVPASQVLDGSWFGGRQP